MKNKGIWNSYKGAVRRDIQKYCEVNGIKEDELCLLNIYKWRSVYEKVIEHFADRRDNYKKGLHWLNIDGVLKRDKEIQYSFNCSGKEDWVFKLPHLVEKPRNKVYLLIEENNKFWICEGYLNMISKIIYEVLYYEDYYIADKKYDWMVTCNHEDIVLFIGSGLKKDELKKL